MSTKEYVELDALIDAELEATVARTKAFLAVNAGGEQRAYSRPEGQVWGAKTLTALRAGEIGRPLSIVRPQGGWPKAP